MGIKSKNHHLRIARNKSDATPNVDLTYFDNPTGPNTWMRGYIQADGSVTDDFELKFGCATEDEELLILIKKELKSEHSLSRIPAGFDAMGRWRGPKTQLQVYGRALVERLVELGILPRKSYLDPPFPDVVPLLLADYCRGVLDGDGSVNTRKTNQTTVYWAGTSRFVHDLRDQVIRATGVRYQPVHRDDNVFRVSWSAGEDLRRLYNWLYPLGDQTYPSLRRKLLKMKEAVE